VVVVAIELVELVEAVDVDDVARSCCSMRFAT
jgi:hypothetical protein